MAVEPLVEEFEQGILRLVPQSEPQQDPNVQYPGQGAKALWDDVWQYGKSIVHYFGRNDTGLSYVNMSTLHDAIDSAVGASIKSLSGFINRAAQIGLDAQQWASMEFDALDANIGAIYGYFDARLGQVEAFDAAVARLALPSLQAQIDALRHDTALGFQYNSAVDRAWATDNIFRPLTDELGQVARDIPVWSEGAYERAKAYTDQTVGALGAHTLEQLVPLTVAVQALQTFKDECAQPMCDTLGPKTDLGKLLKGLKLAGEIAALTAILNMSEAELVALIRSVVARLAAVVGDVEQFVGTGGETVAGLIAHATADLA